MIYRQAATDPLSPINVTVLGTADWDQPIATNQHYVVREMIRGGGANVVFIESIGLRRPQISKRDLARVFHRLRRSLVRRRTKLPKTASRAIPDGVRVVSPLVIPIHSRLFQGLNRKLLNHSLARAGYQGDADIFWTYSPITYGLEKNSKSTVYHCVDLLGEFPGIDRHAVNRHERSLAATHSRAIATSAVVKDHLQRQHFENVLLWENVADVEAIAARTSGSSRQAGRVLFAGNLSPKKIDYAILRELSLRGLDVVLAGPRAEGGGQDLTQFESLMISGITYLGMLTPDELADEMAKSMVGLIPYVDNRYTQGVSPLKVYEYLAAGMAVVSTNIPGVHATPSAIWVERDLASFVDRVVALSSEDNAECVRLRQEIAAEHSWLKRGEAIRGLLSELAEGGDTDD